MKRVFRIWFLSVTTIAALLALSAATYAWFTSNRQVSTNTASARTGEETLELQVSSSGGGSFRSEETATIRQVNSQSQDRLMPVSTADLVNFVYAPSTNGGMASSFKRVEKEEYLYHGRLYLRAEGTGWPSSARLKLYLDQSDGVLGEASGTLLTASRLGMTFDGAASSAVILRLTENESPRGQQVYNTVIGGQTLEKNQVLAWDGTGVRAVGDPSRAITDYTVSFEHASITEPQRPLLEMELNRIYTVDVYFYLEGCDPDCSDSVSYQAADIHLAFYGVIDRGEGG